MECYRLQIEGMASKMRGATLKNRIQSPPNVGCDNASWQAESIGFINSDSTTEIGVERIREPRGTRSLHIRQ